MCKFHDNPVMDMIHDPDTGDIDPVRAAIMKTAMAGYQSTQFLPQYTGLSGNNTYLLATPTMQQAFDKSGLPKDKSAMRVSDERTGQFLSERLERFIEWHRLDEQKLCLPASKKGARRALRNFLVDAAEDIYQDIVSAGRLPFKEDVKNPKHRPLFEMTQEFLKQDGVSEAMQERFRNSVAWTFMAAPSQANGSWIGKKLVALTERKPDNYLTRIQRCGESICTSAVSFMYCKMSCILLPPAVTFLVGEAGPAISAHPSVMFGSMLAGPAVGYGLSEIYYWSRDKYPSATDKKWRERSILAAFALSAMTMNHDEHAGHNHGASVMPDKNGMILCKPEPDALPASVDVQKNRTILYNATP